MRVSASHLFQTSHHHDSIRKSFLGGEETAVSLLGQVGSLATMSIRAKQSKRASEVERQRGKACCLVVVQLPLKVGGFGGAKASFYKFLGNDDEGRDFFRFHARDFFTHVSAACFFECVLYSNSAPCPPIPARSAKHGPDDLSLSIVDFFSSDSFVCSYLCVSSNRLGAVRMRVC